MGQSSVPGRGKFFLEEPPLFEIRDGIVHVTAESGGAEIIMACTPHVLLMAIKGAEKAYAAWAASAGVVRPLRRRGNHAATS